MTAAVGRTCGFCAARRRRLLPRVRHACAYSASAQPAARPREWIEPQSPWGTLTALSRNGLQAEGFAAPWEFRVRGVSMSDEGSARTRQEVLEECRNNDPVLLMREPTNPVDANAVKVLSTKGSIGYVPAELTHMLEHDWCAGYINWVAAAQGVPNSLLGCSVEAIPGMRAAHIQVVPPQLVHEADVSSWLPPDSWRLIEESVLREAGGRCQLLGLSGIPLDPQAATGRSVPIHAQPIWQPSAPGTLALKGFMALCMPAIFAMNYLDLDALQQGPSETSTCKRLLAQLAFAFESPGSTDIARAAAQDLVRFNNAQYDTDAPLSVSRGWDLQAFKEYATLCWQQQMHLKHTEVSLDLQYLLDMRVDGRPIVSAQDFPPSVAQACMTR